MADNNIILKVALDGAQKEIDNLNKLQKEIKVLSDEKKRLSKNEKDLTAAINKSGAATSEQNEQLKKIQAQQVQNTTSLKLNKTAYRENEAQVIRNTKAQQGNTGSLRQMQAQLAKDQFAFDRLSKSERNNINVGGKLQKSIDKQSRALKGLEKSTGRTQRNVGNYGEAMNDVLPIMGGFGGQIMTVQRSLGAMKGALGKVSAGQKGMLASTKATNGGLKAFRIALISTGIGAIVVALGALIGAFLSTQRGVDALTSVMRPLQEIMNSILGVVQNLATSGLDKLKKAFADPKQAVLDLGKAIKDNLITRILAVPKLIKAAAGAYINSFKLIGLGIKKVLADVPLIGKFIDKEQLEKDLTAAKQAVTSSFVDLKDAAIELSIGVDAEKVKEAGEEAAKFFSEAAARGAELDRLQKDIEVNAINLNRELKKGERIYEEQKKIAEDTNLVGEEGAKKRLAAAAAAQAQLNKNVKLQTDQINRELKLAELKTEANDTDREDQKEIQDLIAQKEEVEAKALKKGLLLRNKANSIAQKAEKERIKAIDDTAKAEKKAIKDKNKDDIKAIDAKIAALELGRQLELATIDETNAEKFKKEAELLTEGISDEIERETEKSKIIAEALAIQEVENMVATAELKKEQQNVIDAELLEVEKVKEDNKTAIKNAAIAAGEQFAQEIFKNQNRRIDEGLARDIDALNLKREAGEVSEEEFNKKRLELDKKAFAERKRLAQVQNVIDFAVATGKVIAQTGVFAPAALIPLGIQAAAQAVIIGSQKFAQGGVIHGASHAQGGVPVNVGGSGMIEAEGGEAII